MLYIERHYMRENIHHTYMRMAMLWGNSRSYATRKKVGVLVVKNNQIILKKHPRDDSHYRFYSTKIIECDPLLPGQILFRHFHGDHLFMFPSTICLSEISSKFCVKCDESKKKIFFFQNKNIINPSYLQVFDTVQNIGANIVII